MKVIKIKKGIDINAPKEKVWEVLLKDEYTRNWYSEFSPGSHADTDWKVGSKAIFTDHSKRGMISRVIANNPAEELAVEYEGFIDNGIEDFESEGAKAMKGGIERYKLSGANGNTHLDIESDMGEPWVETMDKQWDNALQKIKKLAEEETQVFQITPYLSFNGKCKEAMLFYKECIGGEITIQTVAETPIANQCPAAMQDQVMHASLTKNGLLLMASDMTGPDGYSQGNAMALALNCTSEDEIRSCFTKLSEGGRVIDELKDQFWGALFGVVLDKYGFTWMLNYTKTQAR